MRITRADRGLVAHWWFTVDRVLLTAIAVLLIAGLIVSLAAGPAVAIKKGLSPFFYVERHLYFALLGAFLIVAISLLTPASVRRLALVIFSGALVLLIGVYFFGAEINGARRWLHFFGQSFQPSEIAKPAFVVLTAWAFSEYQHRPDMPGLPLAVAMWLAFVVLLVVQPDLGQAFLVTLVWGGLMFVSGASLWWLLVLGVVGLLGVAAAYIMFPHARARIDAFIDPDSADTYQMDRARQSFIEGGWFGRGPGEGTVKSILPDANTDFVLAVIAEEYGIVACFVLIGLFLFIAVRALTHAWSGRSAFVRNAISGLVMLISLQAVINMAVNVGLIPAKGMTLPFMSYGGSSLIGVCITMGMLLALSRRRPGTSRLKKTMIVTSEEGMTLAR